MLRARDGHGEVMQLVVLQVNEPQVAKALEVEEAQLHQVLQIRDLKTVLRAHDYIYAPYIYTAHAVYIIIIG